MLPEGHMSSESCAKCVLYLPALSVTFFVETRGFLSVILF